MGLRRRFLCASCSALLVACASCERSNANDGGAAPNVSYATVKLVNGPGSVTSPSLAHPAITVCRIITADGVIHRDTTVDGGAVAVNDLAGDSFFKLDVGARLIVKNGTTSRETIFEGPGDARACVNGDEEMWLTTGVFTSVAGAGESPGAEVWVATPQGVVRYGSGAHVKINVSVPRAEVQLSSGGAFAYPVDGLSVARDAEALHPVDGWYPIAAGATLTLASKRAPSQILGDCEQAAKAAHDLAVQIGTHDASLAEAAPRHVVLRQKAHALCAVAELVAARSFDPVERDRLMPRAHAASAKWRDSSTN